MNGHALVRVWNYVPAINEASGDDLENYRAFCRGRSLAFERRFGPDFTRQASAASAVGCDDGPMVMVFAAHRGPVRHIENPRQVPAYEYPVEHGPRAPTFARATVAELGEGLHAVFISGTSSIRGHESIAPGDTMPQLECTLENLREMAHSCGLGPDLGADRAETRHIKVYLRHARDLATVRARLEAALVRPEDRVSYLRSDICRRELNVEIELSLPRVRLG
jgi:chorismate lyase / 3-hydroxybenzoate synthase